MRNFFFIITLICFFGEFIPTINAQELIMGYQECVEIEGLETTALLDTGAFLSSLHGGNISYFEKNQKEYIRFIVNHPKVSKRIIIETEVLRYVTVRQVNSAISSRRPVVELTVSIGDIEMDMECTITDRSHMSLPLILGRNFLSGRILVDSSSCNLLSD